MASTSLFHVDVFATRPLSGNGLTVFLDSDGWPPAAMQQLTREMRQFESIFLSDVGPNGATARVFTVEEELPFAGHPVLGAAAVLHRARAPQAASCSWLLRLPHGDVPVRSDSRGDHYACEMNQGAPAFGGDVPSSALNSILTRLGLALTDVVAGATAQVISTGLPYLIIPVHSAALSRATINTSDLEERLGAVGAKFILVLDVEGREMRTWDNLGQVEDVATGSAAGPAASFLFHFGFADPILPVALAQGRFAGRPSQIAVVRDEQGNLLVSGEVWPVSHGVLDIDPSGTTDRRVHTGAGSPAPK